MSRRKSKAEHQLTGTYQPSRNTDVVAAEGAPVPLEDVEDVFVFLSTRLDKLGLTGSIDSVGLTLLADQIHMYLLAKKNLGDDIVVTMAGRTDSVVACDPLRESCTATIVVLMGMRKLPEIVQLYRSLGIAETPVGIIQSGSTHKEKTGFGTMENIMDVVSEKGLKSPAIIIIGKVVETHPEMAVSIAEAQVNKK